MSTFDGLVPEFPDIRVDYFRPSPSDSKPALAYFLSHVHSDHLVGLESCKSPFIYCSSATRDILLKLEKYPHRMNFAKGILEKRKQTYHHLKTLLKAIPLETPTVIELSPGKEIRVTLFDANHCVGAVMFLFEGGDSAVLYTGDTRSEPWFVNALSRHPVLLPYVSSSTAAPIKKLDTIYLDTTFVVTGKEDAYAHFPSKADGLRELLQKVARYPQDTLFYVDAWTFGYEDVWQALSTFLGSKIHVDDYRFALHRALANGREPKASESTMLMGFYCGNHFQHGCLSAHSGECRIHSCERGTGCEIWSKDFVRITPIVSRHNGTEIAELGAGGGQDDLNQRHELEVCNAEIVGQLMALCASKLHGQTQLLSSVLQMLTTSVSDRVHSIKLEGFDSNAELSTAGNDIDDLEDFPLEKLVPALARTVTKLNQKKTRGNSSSRKRPATDADILADGLPKYIHFPYSRHSSYNELCQLIEAFKPRNIHPCTVDNSAWTPSSSMGFLFGHIYSVPPSFRYDQAMLKKNNTASKTTENDSKATSEENSPSDYATPDAYATMPQTNFASRVGTNIHRNTPKDDRSNENFPQTTYLLSSKRNRNGRQPQGDFWPSIEIDHYSPPRARKRRKSSTADTSDQQNSENTSDEPALSQANYYSVERLENDRRRRFSATTPPEWQLENNRDSNGEAQHRKSLDYGRLSPPTISRSREGHSRYQQDHFGNSAQHLEDCEEKLPSTARHYSSPNSPRSFSPNHGRLAFRHEVYHAVLDKNGTPWSDIGLVSVSGHQREEEL